MSEFSVINSSQAGPYPPGCYVVHWYSGQLCATACDMEDLGSLPNAIFVPIWFYLTGTVPENLTVEPLMKKERLPRSFIKHPFAVDGFHLK